MTATPDSTARYTSFRIALASGILGAVGATLGWIAWLTAQVLDVELVVTVGVGALLGVLVHWVRHYVRVARAEHAGAQHHADEHGADRRPRHRIAFVWAGGFAFLGLVSEHLVAHMTAAFFQPFLASLASLLPASAIIGWRMSQGRPADDNLFTAAIGGMITGLMITVVTGIIWHFGFGEVPWMALIGWWGMFGIGARLLTPIERKAVKPADPLVALGIVFALTFLLNLMPATKENIDRISGLGGIPLMLRMMAAEIQQSPALPAKFWLEAEDRYRQEHAAKGEATPAATGDSGKRVVPDLQGAANYLTGKTDHLGPAKPKVTRSESLRSWLVMLLVALGIGVAPVMEQNLRPVDYPNSETYRRDLTLAGIVLLLLLLAMRIQQVAEVWVKVMGRK